MKFSIILISFPLLFNFSNLTSQDTISTRLNINLGFPIMPKPEGDQVVKSNNLLFFDIGIEKPIGNNLFYSLEFSNYNQYYRTKNINSYIGVTGDFLTTMLEPSLNLSKELKFKNKSIVDIGLGLVCQFEFDIWLEEKSKYQDRFLFIGGDVGIQSGLKYYQILQNGNQLGFVLESNYFLIHNIVDFGIGIAYQHFLK